MNRFIVPLAAAMFLGLMVVIGWQIAVQDQTRDLLTGVQQQVQQAVQERIVQLPEDGNAWFTSVIVHDDWQNRPDERGLVAAWKSDPTLLSVASQTRFNVLTENDPVYKENLAPKLGAPPMVLVQKPNGEVVYKESGPAVAAQDGQYKLFIVRLIHVLKQHRPCPGPCPKPEPKPEPKPDVTPQPGPPVIPDTIKPVVPEVEFPWAILIAVVVVAFGFSLLHQFRNAVRG